MKPKEFKLIDLPWNEQLKHVIKAYHGGTITYAEYIIKQHEIIGQALMKGITFEEINKFSA